MGIEVFENRPPILGINGMGRIGKLTLWHHVARKHFTEIVINQGRGVGKGLRDVAQFLEKDSTYGTLHRFLHGIKAARVIEIVDEAAGRMVIDGVPVTFLKAARNPAEIPWRDYGVEIVVDATGKFQDPTVKADDKKGSIRGHLEGGARLVINSSAFKIKNKAAAMSDDSFIGIYGINHTAFDRKKHVVISAASCTTTGLAHMMKPLLAREETSRILTASMSTVHAVTNTQAVLDSVPKADAKDLRKTRSILNNIILTSTNAAEALTQVIPEVKEIGFMADSIRIPTSTESLIILNATFQTRPGKDGAATSINTKMLNDMYRAADANDPEHLLVYSDEQNVSCDLIGMNAAVVIEGQFNHTRTAFLTVDLSKIPGIPAQAIQALPPEGLKVPVVHAKIFGWYDNEYGSYTNRLGDLTVYIQKMLNT